MNGVSIIEAPKGLTHQQQDKWFGMARQLEKKKLTEKEMGVRMVRAAVSFTTGLALGYADGAYDYTEVMGIPIAAAGAIAGNLLGLYLGGEFSEVLHSGANACGAIAGWDWGHDLGVAHKQKHPPQNGTSPSNTTPAGYTPYSQQRA